MKSKDKEKKSKQSIITSCQPLAPLLPFPYRCIDLRELLPEDHCLVKHLKVNFYDRASHGWHPVMLLNADNNTVNTVYQRGNTSEFCILGGRVGTYVIIFYIIY